MHAEPVIHVLSAYTADKGNPAPCRYTDIFSAWVMGDMQEWSLLTLRRKETSVLTLCRVVSTAGLSYDLGVAFLCLTNAAVAAGNSRFWPGSHRCCTDIAPKPTLLSGHHEHALHQSGLLPLSSSAS
ncbi:hypothetical protein AV530_000135 [Patagioenas fasciata monilis]|uniref:Uncharacterized protein n=1 Tax=Patagioenas fasciata monilis TaxID=372326 RepID=A0A1V4K1T4_PATFA|nr:hypothetical protein AV530_000135 [Patagioenas fasciata monilis]